MPDLTKLTSQPAANTIYTFRSLIEVRIIYHKEDSGAGFLRDQKPAILDLHADILTVHYEACTHLDRTIHAIHDAGMKAGVVLNPHTAVCLLEDIVQECDLVLLMSVNPGFGGQKFIENTYNKVRQLRAICDRKNPQCLIEVDGGVNLQNAPLLYEAGADVLVAGNAVFKSADPQKTIHDMKQ